MGRFEIYSFIFLVAYLIHGTFSSQGCWSVLENGGASKQFVLRVFHATHSLTLNDLKMLEPTASMKNQVFTINRNKNSKTILLPYAPDIKSDDEDRFSTPTMKLLDLILSDMDERKYFESDYTTVEQIVHTAHMQEHWAKLKVTFDSFKEYDTELCRCALETANSGIKSIISAVNQSQIKTVEPNSLCNNQGLLRYSRLHSHTNYRKKEVIGRKKRETQHEENDDECNVPLTPGESSLVGSAAWTLYKKRLECLENHTFDAALYLFCSLRS